MTTPIDPGSVAMVPVRAPSPPGPFRDELVRSLARGTVRVGTAAIVVVGGFLLLRAAWRAGRAWLSARMAGASVQVRDVTRAPTAAPAPRAPEARPPLPAAISFVSGPVSGAGAGAGGFVSEPLDLGTAGDVEVEVVARPAPRVKKKKRAARAR